MKTVSRFPVLETQSAVAVLLISGPMSCRQNLVGGACVKTLEEGDREPSKVPLVSPCFFLLITLNAKVRAGATAAFLDFKTILSMEVLNQEEKEKTKSLVTMEPAYRPYTAYLCMSFIQDRNES